MGKDETSEPLSKKKGDKIMRKKIAALLAMLMLGGVLTGCGGGNKVATGGEDPNVVPEDTYEINWYMQGMPQEDVASVEAAVNDYLKDKINATLKMHRLESNQYSKQLNTMIAAGEYFDIAWTTPGVLTYTANARNGAWLALDDYIDTYIPKTIEQLGEIADNARVDGKLYAIPTYKEMADSRGWTYRKDIAEKYNINMDNIKTFDELLPVLKMIKENEPNMQYPIDWGSDRTPEALMKYEEIAGTAVIFYDTDKYDGKVVNLVETPEYLEACKWANKLYNEGLVKKDIMTATDFEQRLKDGKTFCYVDFLKPGKAKETSAKFDFELDQSTVSDIWQDNGAGTGSMLAVSRTSKNPERVLRFLELLNTDATLSNLINYGIEGKHYTKIDDNTITIPDDTSYTLQGYQWMQGNVFLNYLTEGESPDKVEALKAFNAEAKKPIDYGFKFDNTAVEAEIAACQTVKSEYRKQVIMGSMDPEPIMKEYAAKLKAAGIDKIIEEAQKQYDEFFSPLSQEHISKLSEEKREYEEKILRIGKKITYVYQKERKGFGHAVYQCREFTNNEPVLLLLGDMIYQSYEDKTCSRQLIDAYEETGKTMVSMQAVPLENVSSYGILAGTWENESENLLKVTSMVEKPNVADAKDSLKVKTRKDGDKYFCAYGQYVLTPEVFEALEYNIENNITTKGEIQLTDALDSVRETYGIRGFVFNGKVYDVGTADNYRETLNTFCRED
jgi:putative aldouronate transport system substrate-binding protein